MSKSSRRGKLAPNSSETLELSSLDIAENNIDEQIEILVVKENIDDKNNSFNEAERRRRHLLGYH